MNKVYTAMGNASDGGIYMYAFKNEDDAISFIKAINAQTFPKHDAFDIKWVVIPQVISESAEFAFNDMTEWAKQIYLRTN